MAKNEELLKKVAEIKATLDGKYQELFQQHCDKSLNLQLTLKERSKDEWQKFLDKIEKKNEPIETIYLFDKEGNRKVDGNKNEMVNLALSYKDIINHPEYTEIKDEKRKKEIILLKAISAMANTKAELEVVRKYLDLTEEKVNEYFDTMLKKNSAIRSKYTNKVTEMEVQLGLREKGEKKYVKIELYDLL